MAPTLYLYGIYFAKKTTAALGTISHLPHPYHVKRYACHLGSKIWDLRCGIKDPRKGDKPTSSQGSHRDLEDPSSPRILQILMATM